MVAVEFDSKERREAVIEAAVKRGLLTLGCGHRSVRLLPPLDVAEREIGLGADLFSAAIGDVTSSAGTRR
jgi:4-aminobutyrate aminotransferase